MRDGWEAEAAKWAEFARTRRQRPARVLYDKAARFTGFIRYAYAP